MSNTVRIVGNAGFVVTKVLQLNQVFKSGNIVSSISMPDQNSILVTSDQNSYILSVDKTSRMNDLLVVGIKERIEALSLVDEEKRVCLAIGQEGTSLKVGTLQGPDFGRKFK